MNPTRGIALKLVSALLFAVMSALVRYLGARYPIGQVVFYRSAFALVPLLVVYAWRGELAAVVRTDRPLGQAGRGVLSIAGMFFNFGAVARLPLVESNAIAFTSPLFSVALAALILKERVRVYRWSAVIIGFVGVLVVLSPHFSGDELTVAMASATSLVVSSMRSADHSPMPGLSFKPVAWRRASPPRRLSSIFHCPVRSLAWRLGRSAGSGQPRPSSPHSSP